MDSPATDPAHGPRASASTSAVELHELTHLKCAVLEYVLVDPDDSAKKQQLAAVMARLLHFTKREAGLAAEAAARASRAAGDYGPLSFFGGFLA